MTAPAGGQGDVLVGVCYTRARRHPLVIGTFPGGGRIWGGPYTVPQFAVMAGLFGAMMLTRGVWGVFGLFNIVLVLAVPYAAGFAVRRVHVDGRNPLAVIASTAGLAAAPRGGRLDGRPLPRLRPKVIAGVCTLSPTETLAAGRALRRGQVPEPGADAPALFPAAPLDGPQSAVPVVSGVQALLGRRAAARLDERNEV